MSCCDQTRQEYHGTNPFARCCRCGMHLYPEILPTKFLDPMEKLERLDKARIIFAPPVAVKQ